MDSLDCISDSVIIEEAIGSVEKEVSQHLGLDFTEHLGNLTDDILLDSDLKVKHDLEFEDDPSRENLLQSLALNPIDGEMSPDDSISYAATADVDDSPSTKKIKPTKKLSKRKFGATSFSVDGKGNTDSRPLNSKRWQQKRVQIKTLEGAFSVTMWSSGEHYVPQVFILTSVNINQIVSYAWASSFHHIICL